MYIFEILLKLMILYVSVIQVIMHIIILIKLTRLKILTKYFYHR